MNACENPLVRENNFINFVSRENVKSPVETFYKVLVS